MTCTCLYIHPRAYMCVCTHTHTQWEDCNRGLGLSSAHFTSISFRCLHVYMLAAYGALLYTRTQKSGCFPHEYWHPTSECFLGLADSCQCGQRSLHGLWCAGCEVRSKYGSIVCVTDPPQHHDDPRVFTQRMYVGVSWESLEPTLRILCSEMLHLNTFFYRLSSGRSVVGKGGGVPDNVEE